MNRVRLAPVALAHAIVKYALTAGRGSRYGCGGVTAGAIAGSVTGSASEPMLFELPCRFVEERANPGELGRDEDSADRAGEFGVVGVVLVRARGDPGTVDWEVENIPLPLAMSDGGRTLETDEDAPRPMILLSRGGAGSITVTGADEVGIGSTVDWR